MSLGFDWAFITGKKKFHWPLVCLSFLECETGLTVDACARFSISWIGICCCSQWLEC